MTPASPRCQIIVLIGTSAGGVEALTELVQHLPADLPAAILITQHLPASAHSLLPAILSRKGKLPAHHAKDGETITPGTIAVAPPGFHMLVKGSQIRLGTGAKENSTRPAIDPLFRTGGQWYGAGAIGVVLTGNLDDGTAGLAKIKQCGGLAIVQDPADALYPGMPESAIASLAVDYVEPLSGIPAAILQAITQARETCSRPEVMSMNTCDDNLKEPDPAEGAPAEDNYAEKHGTPSVFTCPECHGTLWEIKSPGGPLQYRCRVGHAYSPDTLSSEQEIKLEAALWTALRAIEERSNLVARLMERAQKRHQSRSVERFAVQKASLDQQAILLREILHKETVEDSESL